MDLHLRGVSVLKTLRREMAQSDSKAQVDLLLQVDQGTPQATIVTAVEQLKRALAVSRDHDYEEEDAWRRPNARPKKRGEQGEEDEGRSTRRKVVVRCPGQHHLLRFQTTHSSYTCDVCRRTQRKNVTLFGCRVCNWDACVMCHGKMFDRAKQEEEAAAARTQAAEPAKVEEPLPLIPPRLGEALVKCLSEANTSPTLCSNLLTLTRGAALDATNRTSGLRDRTALAISQHIEDGDVAKMGFSALHTLLIDVRVLSNEEVQALCDLASRAIDLHKSSEAVLEKVVAFLCMLHDSCPQGRIGVLTLKVRPILLENLREPKKISRAFVERLCALLGRFASGSGAQANPLNAEEQLLVNTLEHVVRDYADDDQVCEQAFGALLATFHKDPQSQVEYMEKLAKIRYAH